MMPRREGKPRLIPASCLDVFMYTYPQTGIDRNVCLARTLRLSHPGEATLASMSRTLVQGQGGAEERMACPRGAGETPAMGSLKSDRVMPPATGDKRAWSPAWQIAARRLPP